MVRFSAPDTVGVNDPAGLPAWRPIRLSRCRWLAVRRGSAGGIIHPARTGPNPQSIWRRVFALGKQLCCSRSSTVGRRVCSVPRLHPAARGRVVRISQAGLSPRVRPLSASNVERPPDCPLQAPPREPSPRLGMSCGDGLQPYARMAELSGVLLELFARYYWGVPQRLRYTVQAPNGFRTLQPSAPHLAQSGGQHWEPPAQPLEQLFRISGFGNEDHGAPSSLSERQCSKRISASTKLIIPATVLLEPISHQ